MGRRLAALTILILALGGPALAARPSAKPRPVRPELLIQNSHAGAVDALQFSADGRTLMSRGGDSIKEWNARTGDLLANHPAATALSPSLGLTADIDRQARVTVRDLRSGRVIRRLQADSRGTHEAVFSPDSKTLAVASYEQIKLLDLATGQVRSWPEPHLNHLVWFQDGRHLAVYSTSDSWPGNKPRPLFVMDTKTGQTLTGLTERWSGADIAVSPDGTRLAAADPWSDIDYPPDRTVHVYPLPDGRPIATLAAHTKAVMSLAFSPDGRTLASGAQDGTVRLWDVATASPRAILQHPEPTRWTGHSQVLQGLNADRLRAIDSLAFVATAGALPPPRVKASSASGMWPAAGCASPWWDTRPAWRRCRSPATAACWGPTPSTAPLRSGTSPPAPSTRCSRRPTTAASRSPRTASPWPPAPMPSSTGRRCGPA